MDQCSSQHTIAKLFNDCFYFFLSCQLSTLLSTLYFPENFIINVSGGRSLNAELCHFPKDIIIKLW